MNEEDHQPTESGQLPTRSEQLIPRKPKRRPDGSNVGSYRGYEKWTYHRWAWEFLRRNDDFIKACATISPKSSEEEKQKTADQFGLKKYKFCREGYLGASGKPVFAIGSISTWSNMSTEPQEEETFEVTLQSGQILARFDIARAVVNPKILEKQLQQAGIRLRNRLAQYKSARGIQRPTPRVSVSKLLEYLRMLDCSASGKTQADCELVVNPFKADDPKKVPVMARNQSIQKTGHRKLKRAKKYTSDLYNVLAVCEGCPSIDSSRDNHFTTPR